ncbi:MAG: hypothetical protein ACFB00_13155 [Parvularculaceae bacterium]
MADLDCFSFRELLGQRALATRAIRRGRNVEASERLIARIDVALERRRLRIWAKRSADAPRLDE